MTLDLSSILRPASGRAYLSPRLRVLVNALILGLGLLAALAFGLNDRAFAKETRTVSFDGTQQELAALVGDTVRVTAWMTYVPENRDRATLRGAKASFLKSLFGTAPEDGTLAVRIHKLPLETRVWLASACAGGCRVNVEGTVLRTAAGHVTLDVMDVDPAN